MEKLSLNPRQSLTDQAYSMIHTAISDGTFPPGMLLSENHLARELKMSRTPVREALHVLESQDFVEIRDGLGTFVKTLTLRDLRDLFQIRLNLETLAISTAVDHISESEIDQLEEQFHILLDKNAKGERINLEEFAEVDSKLHDLMIDHCQNKYVKQFMQAIMANVKRCQLMSLTFLDDVEESTTQHLELLVLIRSREKEKLAEKLKEHIAWSLKCCTEMETI